MLKNNDKSRQNSDHNHKKFYYEYGRDKFGQLTEKIVEGTEAAFRLRPRQTERMEIFNRFNEHRKISRKEIWDTNAKQKPEGSLVMK